MERELLDSRDRLLKPTETRVTGVILTRGPEPRMRPGALPLMEASMFKKVLIAAGLATVLVWVVSAQSDLKSVVDKSMKAMGVENVKTLTLIGEGGDGSVGQAYSPQADRWR